MSSHAASASQPVPPSILSDEGPDFDAYIESVARSAAVFSRPVEAILTFAMVFSTAFTPFVMLGALVPNIVVEMFSTPWMLMLFIPYIIAMAVLGLKASSLFGCQTWWRVTRSWHEG